MACCVGLLLPIVLLFTAEIPIHNWTLQRFSGSLAAMQHSPESTLVQTLNDVGNFGPTGNQCEYFIAQVRCYTGPKKRIQDLYEGAKLKSPVTGFWKPVQLGFIENGAVQNGESLPTQYRNPQSWAIPSGTMCPKLFIVFARDGGHDPGLDYRCL